MSHETLQALYALDVAEVGEEEAAKRWEYSAESMNNWYPRGINDPWYSDLFYRRKPGIHWPKVMMQEFIQECQEWPADTHELSEHASCVDVEGCPTEMAVLKRFWKEHQNTTAWPADAPEWANAAIITWCKSSKELVIQGEQRLIERPKPAVKKIDWSKLPLVVKNHMAIEWGDGEPLSSWIAWNCDEHTRGNPLPDGLVVEWYGAENLLRGYLRINWEFVTRFRIVGIQEGWE